jgi:hypothetical protein
VAPAARVSHWFPSPSLASSYRSVVGGAAATAVAGTAGAAGVYAQKEGLVDPYLKSISDQYSSAAEAYGQIPKGFPVELSQLELPAQAGPRED